MTVLLRNLTSGCILAVILIVTLFLMGSDAADIEDAAALGGEIATLNGGAFTMDGGSYRQDFCTRYKEVIGKNISSVGVRNALSGEELSISLLSGKYFRYDSEKGIDPDYPGIHAQLLDYMAEQGNFTWRTSFGVWDQDQLGNQSWSDVLLWGVEKFDAMAGPFTISPDRINKGISFVDGHFDGSLIMVRNVQPSEPKLDIWNFFGPFERMVWLVIFAIIVFSSITYQLIERIGEDPDSAQKSFRKRVMNNLYLSFINVTGNYSYEPQTLGGRVFGLFFAFWAMLITAAYTANLASILVVTNLPSKGIQDIQGAFDQGMKICISKGSHGHDYLLEKYPEAESHLLPMDSSDLMADALNEGQCEIMIQAKQEFHAIRLQEKYNPSCKMEWQGREIQHLSDGFATKLDPGLQCTDLVNEVFTYYMNEMKENGFLETKWDEHNKFYATEGHCSNQQPQSRRLGEQSNRLLSSTSNDTSSGSAVATAENPDSYALSLRDMAGTMLFQVMGSVVAIVVALLSGCDRKTKAKRISKRCSEGAKTAKVIPVDDSLREQLSVISRQLQELNEKVAKMERSRED